MRVCLAEGVRESKARTLTVAFGRSECSYSRKPTFSPTVRESKRAPLWNTIPMCSEVAVAGASSDSSPFLGMPCGSGCHISNLT